MSWGSVSVIREKCLLVKEKWALRVDTCGAPFDIVPAFSWLVECLSTLVVRLASGRPAAARRRLRGGGIGALLKRHPPWPDLPQRDEITQASSAARLKRLFCL